MDWAGILVGVVTALVTAIGLPLALRKRKKEGTKNVEQLLQHLQEIKVKASLLERGGEEEKVGASRSFAQRIEGVIKLEGRNIDYINVISVASQYGVQYFLGYLVTTLNWQGNKKKKTKMVRKKSSGMWGRVTDLLWKGDDYLSRELNIDYRLKDKLLQLRPEELKGGIVILPQPKYGYTMIKTTYSLPSADLFETINIIAGHIKAGR